MQNHAVPFSSFQVTRVARVQNPILWVNYHNRCALIKKAGPASPALGSRD